MLKPKILSVSKIWEKIKLQKNAKESAKQSKTDKRLESGKTNSAFYNMENIFELNWI